MDVAVDQPILRPCIAAGSSFLASPPYRFLAVNADYRGDARGPARYARDRSRVDSGSRVMCGRCCLADSCDMGDPGDDAAPLGAVCAVRNPALSRVPGLRGVFL